MKAYEKKIKEALNIQRFLNMGMKKGCTREFEGNNIVISEDHCRIFMSDLGTVGEFVFTDGNPDREVSGEYKVHVLNLFSLYEELPEYEVARIVLNRKWLKEIVDTMDSDAVCLEWSKDRPLKISEVKETYPKKSAMIAPRLED